MAKSDLDRVTPDREHVGENIARTVRIIAKLLLEWSKAESNRRALRRRSRARDAPQENLLTLQTRPLPALHIIAFDKLAMCFSRVWDALHDMEKTRYAPAFIKRHGFHGPGIALKIDRTEEKKMVPQSGFGRRSDYAFIAEVVEKLTPGLGTGARDLFRFDEKRRYVTPQLDDSLWEAWLHDMQSEDQESAFLTRQEYDYVGAMGSYLSQLNAKQVRVLGVHCSAVETMRSIDFNFKRGWEPSFQRVLDCLRGDCRVEIEKRAQRLVTTAQEIFFKSDSNRKLYEQARNKVLEIITNEALRLAFEKTYKTAKSIWEEDARLAHYREAASILLDFSLYCRRGLMEINVIPTMKKGPINKSDAAFARMQTGTLGLSLPPYSALRALPPSEWADKLQAAKQTICALIPIPAEGGVP